MMKTFVLLLVAIGLTSCAKPPNLDISLTLDKQKDDLIFVRGESSEPGRPCDGSDRASNSPAKRKPTGIGTSPARCMHPAAFVLNRKELREITKFWRVPADAARTTLTVKEQESGHLLKTERAEKVFSGAAPAGPVRPLQQSHKLARDYALRFGHSRMGDVSGVCVDAFANGRIVLTGALQSLGAEFRKIGKRRVGERVRGGMRNGGGHVRHAVVQHAIDEINRIGVGGGVRGLEASALIDGDVHHHRAWLHGLQHFAPHQSGSRRAGNQYRANHEIGIADSVAHGEDVGCQRDHLAAINVVQRAQPVEIAIDDDHVRAHTDGHLGRIDGPPLRRPG